MPERSGKCWSPSSRFLARTKGRSTSSSACPRRGRLWTQRSRFTRQSSAVRNVGGYFLSGLLSLSKSFSSLTLPAPRLSAGSAAKDQRALVSRHRAGKLPPLRFSPQGEILVPPGGNSHRRYPYCLKLPPATNYPTRPPPDCQ